MLWRDPPANRPEQQMIGVQFTAQLLDQPPYVVTNSGSWVYAGTGFKDGNQVQRILGYEVDRNFATYPQPSAIPGTYTLVSRSPVTSDSGAADYGNSSVYQALSGARVFAAGTISWSQGLGATGVTDSRIQRTTQNVLDTFVFAPLAPRNVVATRGEAQVSITWSANPESNIRGYNIYRGTSLPVSTTGTPANGTTPLTTTSFLDGALRNGTRCYYTVEAGGQHPGLQDGRQSGQHHSTGVRCPGGSVWPEASRAGSTKNPFVNLSWTDNATNETSHVVERSPDGATFAAVATLGANASSYKDSGASGRTYWYCVRALNAAGSSAPSNMVSAATR